MTLPDVEIRPGQSAEATHERAFVLDALKAEGEAIARLETHLGPELHEAIRILDLCKGHVVTTGMGKSGLIAQKISATLSSIGVPSHFLHPAEAVHGDLGRVRREDVVWAMSYSGNTEEVVVLATLLKADGVKVVGMSSNPASRLGELADVHLSIGDITEACPMNLAPTASTTAMLALGDAVGLAVSRRRCFNEEDYRKCHPGGMLGLGLRPITEVLRFRVGHNLPLLRDTLTVGEALQKADDGARRPGAMILVDENNQMTGLFTDGDLRRLVLKEGNALHQPIADVMTRHPMHLTTEHLVRDAVQLVRERRPDEIPVVDEHGCPIGLIDVQDLIALKVIDE